MDILGIMKLWILFKSCIFSGASWHSSGGAREATLPHFYQVCMGVQILHSASIEILGWAGATVVLGGGSNSGSLFCWYHPVWKELLLSIVALPYIAHGLIPTEQWQKSWLSSISSLIPPKMVKGTG